MLDDKKTEQQWDKVYKNFKENRLSVWSEDASLFLKNKIEFLKGKNIKRILDAGCGDGRNLLVFAQAGFEVVGIDISSSALKKCKKICNKFSNVTLRKGSLEKMSTNYKKFDAIICDYTLVHIKNVEVVIKNFHTALKNKGYTLLEFTSVKDPLYGKGKKIDTNEFIQEGVYVRFFTVPLIKKLLKKFKIISIDSEYFTQPHHGSGYYRKKGMLIAHSLLLLGKFNFIKT